MISEHIGRVFVHLCDRAARGLLRAGLRPNHITLLGMLFTVAAGGAIAGGPSAWHTWALGFLVAAGACDLLDGTMAELGRLHTRLGAVLDSACDRVSDAALYFGPVGYLVLCPVDLGVGGRPNLTLIVLACAGLLWAYLTSYIRARAENVGIAADGGFWQRPERVVTILLGVACHNLATALWMLGVLPATTVVHRMWRVWRSDHAATGGAAPASALQPRGLAAVVLWRWDRGTLPFDLYATAMILALVFVDVPVVDPLRRLLEAWFGVGA